MTNTETTKGKPAMKKITALAAITATALDAAEVPVNVARKYLNDGYNRVNNRDQ